MRENEKPAPVNVVCFRHGGTHLLFPLIRNLCGYHEALNDVLKINTRRRFMYANPSRGIRLEFRPPKGKIIICWRDPRNLIVSKIRHGRKKAKYRNKRIRKDAALQKSMSKDRAVSPDDFGGGHIQQMLRVARRWENVKALRIPFEVITNPETGPESADEIAGYLGVDGGVENYRKIYGTGRTFNKTKTDWREWCGKKTLAIFEDKGGRELVERLGYEWEVPRRFRGHEFYRVADDKK